MKVEVPLEKANRLINHGPVILVTSAYRDKKNIITLAWHTPVSHKPKLLAICIYKKHFSHELIEKTKEFVINLPTFELLKQTHYCGTVSGRKVDKFQKAGLTPLPAHKVKAPLIKECIAHIECRVIKIFPGGDHSIFLAEVLYASAEKGVFKNTLDIIKAKTIHHLGENIYTLTAETIKPE